MTAGLMTREQLTAAVNQPLTTRVAGTRVPPAGTRESVWDDARKFYKPTFPSVERIAAVTEEFASWASLPAWDGDEGSRARIEVAPGLVRIRYKNLARHEKRHERAATRHPGDVDELARYFAAHGEFPPEPSPTRRVKEWSRKSRTNFWAALHELDYEAMLGRGRVPAMMTLTYPSEWLMLAPNGAALKRQMKILRKRIERTWGAPMRCVWKLEFQRRGAPHLHFFYVPPKGKAPRGRHAGMKFTHWLSAAWADIVDHPDPDEYEKHLRAGTAIDYPKGVRATDPRRVAVYFAKHGSFRDKEYQNQVPVQWQEPGNGPGRFWGYWNLKRRVYAVEVSHETATLAARLLRGYARAQGVIVERAVPRYRGGKLQPTGPVIGLAGAQAVAGNTATWRTQRRRARRMTGRYGAGWLSVNNGAHFLEQLARYLGALYDPLPG